MMNFTFNHGKAEANLEYGNISISPNKDLGFRPYELFISSLVGCSSYVLGSILTKRRVCFDQINIHVSSERNSEKANRIEQITIMTEVITESQISDVLSKKLADLVIKNCGMIQSVIECIDIRFQIVTKES